MEGEFLALGIGNGRQAGGGHVLCPQARVDDGLLDVSILPTPQDMVGTLGTLLGGGNGVESLFVRARVPWLEVEAAEGLDVNLDGEPLEDASCVSRFPRARCACTCRPVRRCCASRRAGLRQGRLIRCLEWRLCLVGLSRDTV